MTAVNAIDDLRQGDESELGFDDFDELKYGAEQDTPLDDPTFLEQFEDKDISNYVGWQEEVPAPTADNLLTNEESLYLRETRSASTKPSTRLMMGLGLSGLVGVGFLMLVGGFGGTEEAKPKVAVASSDTLPLLSNGPGDQQLRTENANLKAAAANDDLGKSGQPIALKGNKPKPGQMTTAAPVVRSSTMPAPQEQPTRISARYIPQPPPPQPVYRAAAPYQAPSRTQFRAPSVPSPNFTASAPIEDPASAIKRLTELGVVEDSDKSGNSGISSIASTPGYQNTDYIASNAQVPDYQTANASLPSDVPVSSPAQTTGTFTVEQGQEARADLKTPIMWNNDINISGQTYAATLTKAFGSIPKGASLTLQLDPTQAGKQTGLLKLIPVSFSVKGVDYPVSSGIAVMAPDNGVIVAKKITPGGGGGFKDVLGFFSGTVSTALGGNGIQGSQDNILSQIGSNAASNLSNRFQQTVQSLNANGRNTDRSYYRFDGSIKLIALLKVSL